MGRNFFHNVGPVWYDGPISAYLGKIHGELHDFNEFNDVILFSC